uniref:Pecanex-like protein n=1 Tax=Macrostomum lignano TaxID=282301 RepID=A0A1I8FHQ1_9PLAT
TQSFSYRVGSSRAPLLLRRQLASTAGPETNNSNGTGGPATVKNCQRIPAAPGPAERDPGNLGRLAAQGYLQPGWQFKLRYYLSPVPLRSTSLSTRCSSCWRRLGAATRRLRLSAAIWRGRPTGAACRSGRVWARPDTRLRMSGYSPYSAAENSILLCRLSETALSDPCPTGPWLVVLGLRSGLLARRCYGNPGTGAAIWRAVLTGSQRPGHRCRNGRRWRLLADLTAGLWSHSVLRVLRPPPSAPAARSSTGRTDWP